jgi:hypothetical protein
MLGSMRSRMPALAAVPLLLVLAACGPGTPPPDASPDEPGSGSGGGSGAPVLELADTDVMGVTAVATASNGAVLDIQLVVHAPEPFSADGAADAWSATTSWCEGEIDDSLIAGQGFSFTTVDVTATTREGQWPADTPLLIQPQPWPGTTTASGGELVQVDASFDENLQGGSVPHCAQPVLLTGAGAGQLYLGIVGDIDGDGSGTVPLGGWANFLYGVNIHTPEGDADVTLSDCTVQLTDLAGDLGAPTPDWQQNFTAETCTVGGVSGQG